MATIAYPSWGSVGCPALPRTLRATYRHATVEASIAAQCGLPTDIELSNLDASVWADTHLRWSGEFERYLCRVMFEAADEIADTPVLDSSWPDEIDIHDLPVRPRTRAALARAHLLNDTGALAEATYAQLIGLSGMEAASVLDLACVVEAATGCPGDLTPAVTAAARSATAASPRPAGPLMAPALGAQPAGGRAACVDEPLHPDPPMSYRRAPWFSVVTSRDPRFSPLLPPGTRSLELLVGEDPPAGLTSNDVRRCVEAVARRADQIASLPLETALAELVRDVMRDKRRGAVECLMRRLGLVGSAPESLTAVAAACGVSRGYVRQIADEFAGRVQGAGVYLPQLDRAIALLEEATPVGIDDAGRRLKVAGITSVVVSVEGVLGVARVLGRTLDLSVAGTNIVRLALGPPRYDAARRIIALARRRCSGGGAAAFDDVLDDIRRAHLDVRADQVRLVLCSDAKARIVDGWVVIPSRPHQNRVLHASRLILAASPVIPLRVLTAGVERALRFRGVTTTPAPAAIRTLLEMAEMATVGIDETVRSTLSLEPMAVLSSTDGAFLRILSALPGATMSVADLRTQCTREGMSRASFDTALQASPILQRVGPGLYGLRGQVPADDRPVGRAGRRVLQVVTPGDDLIRIRMRVPRGLARSTVKIPVELQRALGGRRIRTVVPGNGVEAQIGFGDNGTSWGYGPLVEALGVRAGAEVVLDIDLDCGVAAMYRASSAPPPRSLRAMVGAD